jgi:GTPase SAR1 family protein
MGKSQSKHKQKEYDFFKEEQKAFLKIVVLGPAKVGKTSILRQHIDNKFTPQYWPTIGADFL